MTDTLLKRYASPEMAQLFSPPFKYATWRRLWVALARAQKRLGLPITDVQIQALEARVEAIDFDRAAEYEKRFRHDVMAHIHAYADVCPEARPIIHLGATSCFVTDNTDLIQMRQGLRLLAAKTVSVIRSLATFARQHAALPTLGYTHFQSAQPTTVGKRACLWIQDLLLDLEELWDKAETLRFLGVKGATGTQASFLSLLEGDSGKVAQLEASVAQEMGFARVLSISGQTYTRKQDMRVFAALSGCAATAHKFATDIRLLAHLKEVEEPSYDAQVGSSAMPHKQNPVLCERICGLARFLLSLNDNAAYTASTQWLERSLDDSANRRLSIPEAFLSADAVLNLFAHVAAGLVVHSRVIAQHLQEELPFLGAETVLMEAVKRGKDRQTLHEALRQHSRAASHKMKEEGARNDLLDRIAGDPLFGLSLTELQGLLDSSQFTGRAEEQTLFFLRDEVDPVLLQHRDLCAPLPAIDV
jgi:adenylosuccinate lyase